MPRYFFSIEDGAALPDIEGADFPDLTAARSEALLRCGTVLAGAQSGVETGRVWRMTVQDDWGLILFVLRLSMDCPAMALAGGRSRAGSDQRDGDSPSE